MVCAKRTIVSDIVLDAPDATPRQRGSCVISFGLFGDGVSVDRCMVCAKCTIGSDIVLDSPDDVGHVESCSVRLEMVLVLM